MAQPRPAKREARSLLSPEQVRAHQREHPEAAARARAMKERIARGEAPDDGIRGAELDRSLRGLADQP